MGNTFGNPTITTKGGYINNKKSEAHQSSSSSPNSPSPSPSSPSPPSKETNKNTDGDKYNYSASKIIGRLLVPPQFGTGCDVHFPPPSRSSSHRSQTAATLLSKNETNNGADDPLPPYVVASTTVKNHRTTIDGKGISTSFQRPSTCYGVVEEWIRRPNAGCAPAMALLSGEHLVKGLWISACSDPLLDSCVTAEISGAELGLGGGNIGSGGIRGSKLFFSRRGDENDMEQASIQNGMNTLKKDGIDGEVLIGGLDLSMSVPVAFGTASSLSSSNRTGGSVFFTRHLLPLNSTKPPKSAPDESLPPYSMVNRRFSIFGTMNIEERSFDGSGSSAIGSDDGNISANSRSTDNRYISYDSGTHGLTTTCSLARIGWNYGTIFYLPQSTNTTKTINHRMNNDHETAEPMNFHIGSSARYFTEGVASSRRPTQIKRRRRKKREIAGLSSHCCLTVPSRGITAAVELDLPIDTTTDIPLPPVSSFAPVSIATSDPYAPPESPPLHALLKDYWSGTAKLLPRECLLGLGLGTILPFLRRSHLPSSTTMFNSADTSSGRLTLDWPVLSYALSFDLNHLGSGYPDKGFDHNDANRFSGDQASPSLQPSPIILTMTKSSSPKNCALDHPNNTTDFSSTSSVTVSQNIAHCRAVTNPLEDRGVDKILNTVSWAVQLSRHTNTSTNHTVNGNRLRPSSSSTISSDMSASSPDITQLTPSPTITTSLTAALAWQVNRGLCYKLRADTDDGITLGILLKRWTHPRVTCSLLFGSGSGGNGASRLHQTVGFKGMSFMVETGPLGPQRQRRDYRTKSDSGGSGSDKDSGKRVCDAKSFLYNPGVVYPDGMKHKMNVE